MGEQAKGAAGVRLGETTIAIGEDRNDRAVVTAALLGLALLGSGAAHSAQDWPSKPVRIITGFAAGGIGDLGARLLAEHITRTTGQQAVVENRTGAAGTLGMDAVAKAAPDGTTLGLALNGNLVINPFIQKSMPFDALKDLVPVAAIGDAPQMIALSHRGAGQDASRNSRRWRRPSPAPSATARPGRARCRIFRWPSSRAWPASSSCTCRIAATRRP